MMNRKTAWTVVACGLMLNAWVLYRFRERIHPEVADAEQSTIVWGPPPGFPPDPKLEAYIEGVRNRSVAELEDALAEPEWLVSSDALGGGLSSELRCMHMVLVDRRVGKIYAAYLDMEKDEARVRAQAQFEKWLAEHANRLDQVVKLHAKTGGIEITIGTRESHHACAASLFLASQFCKPSYVVSSIELWDKIGRRAMQAVQSAPIPTSINGLRWDGPPGDLLTLNLYLASLRARVGYEEAARIAREQIKIPEASVLTACCMLWDSNPCLVYQSSMYKPQVDVSRALAKHIVVETWSYREPTKQGFLKRSKAAMLSRPVN